MGRNHKKKSQKVANPIDLYFLIISTVIVIPLIFSSKVLDPNLAPRLLALGIIIFVLSVINIIKPVKDWPQFDFTKLIIFPVFFLYFLCSIFSLTQAINPAEGLFDITKTFLSIGLLIFAIQIFITYNNSMSLLVKSVVVSSIIATSIGLFQYFDKMPGNMGYKLFIALYEIKGLMAHKNQFAISLFLMLPFTLFGLYKFRKWWWSLSFYSTLMILLNIAILQTRSVWLATFVFILSFILLWFILSIKKKKSIISGLLKIALIIAIVLIVVGSGSYLIFQKSGGLQLLKYQVSSITDASSDNNQGRLKMWESTWELSKDNLFFGVGAGNWKISVLPYYNLNFGIKYQNWRRPHNDFLWVLSEKGIFGLISYLLIFIIIAIYSFKILFNKTDKDKLIFTVLMISGIGGYFIIAFFTFPLERINQQVYIMLMMAGIISVYYKKPAKPKQKKSKFYIRFYIVATVISVASIYYSGVLLRSEVYMQKLFEAKKTNNWKMMLVYADKAFTKLSTIDSFSMPIHLYKGVSNMKLRNGKHAYEDFQIALRYFPTQITILNNLASLSSLMGDNKKAVSYFNQSLEIFPHYETSLFNLSKAYYRNKEYSKAYVTFLNCDPKKAKDNYIDFVIELKQKIDISTK